MSDVIKFPVQASSMSDSDAKLPAEPITEEDIAKLHSSAFQDLEGEVCDLDRMGEIANDLIMNCAAREDDFRNLELATFAVWQLAKMLKEFKGNYYKRWHGEMVGVS